MCLFDLLKLVGISFPPELYGPMQSCSHLIHPTPLPFTNLNVLHKLQMKGLVGFSVFMVEDTVKILKFGTHQTIAIIVLKIEKFDVTLH